MLETFRKISHNPVFKVLFGILVVAFLFSGAGLTRSHFNFFSNNYLVKVGREIITQERVDKKYDETVRNIRRSGTDFTPEQLEAFGISKAQILRSMVHDSLIHQEVVDLGLETGDDAVAEQIKNIPQFQSNGTFSRERFNNTINALGMTEDQFTASLRAELRNNMLLDTISNSIPVNDFISRKQAASAGETRDVEIAVIPKSFKPTLSEPSEQDLKSYYNDNSYRFQVPESRDINYVRLPRTKDKTSYDTTTKIEDELAGGATLKEISEKMSLKLESKKALLNNSDEFSALFLQTAFGKDKGQISDLVHDEKSDEYFVIEITDVKPARIPNMSEVKDKVITAWKENNANDQNLKYIGKMADELKNSSGSLQSFAASNGYKYEVIKAIKRSDTETYGARLVNAAFDAKTGDVLGSFQNEDGTYKIAKLREIKQPTLSAEEQTKYKLALAGAIRTEIMDEYFEALRKKYPVKKGDEADKKAATPTVANEMGAVGTDKKTAIHISDDGLGVKTSKIK